MTYFPLYKRCKDNWSKNKGCCYFAIFRCRQWQIQRQQTRLIFLFQCTLQMTWTYQKKSLKTWFGCLTSWALRWRHEGRDRVSNHQPHDCLLNRLFRRRSRKTLKLRVTGLCAGNSPGTGEFPAQMASNAENVSIWWRHHGYGCLTSWGLSILDAGLCKYRTPLFYVGFFYVPTT